MYVDYDVLEWYNFEKYDVLLGFLHYNSQKYDPFIPILMYLFVLFLMFCEHSLYWLNSQTITWKWWHQLVVQNQDRYYECLLKPKHLALVQSNRERLIKDKIGTFVPSKFIVKILSRKLAKIHIWMSLDNIDKRRYFGQPLSLMPNLSHKLRRKLVLLLILVDKFACFVQLLPGKFFLTSL